MSMESGVNRMRRLGLSVALLAGFGPLAGIIGSAPVAWAQNQPERVVQGKVENKAGDGIKATVYLKDGHTLAVKSYVAGDDGAYRFGQLGQNADYQLWAEADGKKSSTKNISSFDTRKQFDINLKIDK
jgi:hypothetical protein